MKPLSRSGILAYSLGSLAAGLFYAFNNFTLPPYLRHFTGDNVLIGLLSSTRSAEQAVVQPLVGGWSDRTWTRVGRRAPFFIVAMPFSALFFVVTGLIPVNPAFLWPVVACVFLFSFLFNIGIDPYVALLADVTPTEQRGTVNGVAGFLGFLGQVLILVAAAGLAEQHPAWVMDLVAVGLVIGFAIVAWGVREPRTFQDGRSGPVANDPLLKRSLKPYVGYVRDRWNHEREAVKLLGVRFLYQFGINAAVPFLTLFVITAIGTRGWPELVGGLPAGLGTNLAQLDETGVSQVMGAILLAVTGLTAVPCGLLGSRFGKKPVFALGLLLMGVTALFAAFAETIPQLLVFLLPLGLGNAAATILFFPYLSDLVPPERVGEFQGLSATAETGGVFLSALAAGALINLNLFGLQYRLIFVITGIFLLLGFAAVWFVKARLESGDAETTLLRNADC